MPIKAEFHCHSNASDGKLTPYDVVKRAHKNDVSILALTDHDITLGLDEASDAAKEFNIEFIPGIELSCEHKGSTVHVLGYFKDNNYKNPELQKFLNELKASRIARAKKIVDNLKKHFNIHINHNEVLKKGNGVVARPHIAESILEAGYDYPWEYIFEKFIGNDSPAYVPNQKISVEEGITLLKKYNALTILAHPKLIKKCPISEVLAFPFDGIEAVYFQNFKRETEFFLSHARKNNMLITCGSDFHGINENDEKHGDIGDMSIDDADLEKFLKALKS
ncbi:hypothetical protein SAMN02745163_00956 [Clostridium cavendishii DSM 21758]|uniref:Polymerase/histidinol phosphatase N-terminal domain-containing protein n=1 Tax=Clostridium cavendishii DSM 21758 TaxID=1121302 RepID=A0A1M6EVE9_9CLOT|nr:PHP domain-containing protein [Clostridium cavendishii]SHI89396.1 hypothetical protein SAMN02745163_00956 [Clostridium cavendishii DSM 21758]